MASGEHVADASLVGGDDDTATPVATPDALKGAPRTMKEIKKLVLEDYAKLDLSGISKQRFVILRRTLLLVKYSKVFVNYVRYHEGIVGPLTLFGEAKRTGEKSLIRHAAKIARHSSMQNGGTISRLSNVITANQKQAASSILLRRRCRRTDAQTDGRTRRWTEERADGRVDRRTGERAGACAGE